MKGEEKKARQNLGDDDLKNYFLLALLVLFSFLAETNYSWNTFFVVISSVFFVYFSIKIYSALLFQEYKYVKRLTLIIDAALYLSSTLIVIFFSKEHYFFHRSLRILYAGLIFVSLIKLYLALKK